MDEVAVRSARPSRMRWAYGAVLAMCAALAVLVHHESAAFTVSSMPMAPSPHVALPVMAHGSVPAAHGLTPAVSPDNRDNRAAAAMVHGDGAGACGAMGGQHCSTASLSTVSLAPPPSGAGVLIAPPPVVGSALPPRTIGRAPPDLSVLSSLRT